MSSSGDQCGDGGTMALRRPLAALLFTVLSSHRSRGGVMLRQSRVAASSLPQGSGAAAVCKLTVNSVGAAAGGTLLVGGAKRRKIPCRLWKLMELYCANSYSDVQALTKVF